MKMENRFGSFGMVKSETIYLHLYMNQRAFSIKMRILGTGVRISTEQETCHIMR